MITLPLILGYNTVRPRAGFDVIATWGGSDDPAMTAGQFGDCRVLAYTSDPAPHWGCNFNYRNQYNRLWSNALALLLTNTK